MIYMALFADRVINSPAFSSVIVALLHSAYLAIFLLVFTKYLENSKVVLRLGLRKLV